MLVALVEGTSGRKVGHQEVARFRVPREGRGGSGVERPVGVDLVVVNSLFTADLASVVANVAALIVSGLMRKT